MAWTKASRERKCMWGQEAFQNQGQKFECNKSPRCTASKTFYAVLITRQREKSSTCQDDRGTREDTVE